MIGGFVGAFVGETLIMAFNKKDDGDKEK